MAIRSGVTALAFQLLSVTLILTISPARADLLFQTENKVNDIGYGVQSAPNIAAFSNGSFGIVWQDSRNQSMSVRDYDVYYAILDRYGHRLTKSVRVNDDTGNKDQFSPNIAISADGIVHVVWLDSRNGGSDIYYARAIDGIHFASNRLINVSRFNEMHPSIAVDPDGNPHFAWTDDRQGDPDIFHTRSDDGGNTLEPASRVSNETGTAYQLNPRMAISAQGDVWVGWSDYRNDADGRWFDFGGSDGFNDADAYLRCLCSGSWGPEIRVNRDTTRTLQGLFDVAATESAVIVSWTDYKDDADGFPWGWPPWGGMDGVDNGDIYVSATFDRGATFTPEIRVNDDTVPHSQTGAFVAIDNRDVHAVWADSRGGSSDIYYARVNLTSLNFPVNVRVHGDLGDTYQGYPSIAIGQKLAVAWTDTRDDPEMDVFAAIMNRPPIANADGNRSVPSGTLVMLNGTGSCDPDGDMLSFHWTQLGGPMVDWTGSDTPNPAFTADRAGRHTFLLLVDDGYGGNDSDTVSIFVWGLSPIARLSITPSTAIVDVLITFDGGLSSDPDGSIMTYTFDFGDGVEENGTASSRTHSYSASGTYAATLTVTDNDGNASSVNLTVTITTKASSLAFIWYVPIVIVFIVLLVVLAWRIQRRRNRAESLEREIELEQTDTTPEGPKAEQRDNGD